MAKKNNTGISRSIFKYILIIPAIFSLATNLCSLAQNEIMILRKKLILLFMLAIFCLVLTSSVWMCASGLLLAYFLSVNLTLMMSIALTLMFNLLLLIITSLAIKLFKIDPFCPETRKVIRELISN